MNPKPTITLKSGVYLFIIISTFKITEASYQAYLTRCSNPDRSIGVLAISSGDTFSYTGAMENYIQTGTYFFDNGKERVYAGRMPYYSLPYLLFRNFFNLAAAYDAVVIFQVVIESLAILYFGLTLLMLGCSKITYWIGVLLLIFSYNFSHSSNYISPESLTSSLILIFIYTYLSYVNKKNNTNLFVLGLMIALLACLKAYMVLIPLVVVLTPWIIRNYGVYKKFVPLQITTTAGYSYTEADFAYRKFVQAWGGDIIFWEKSAAGCYFIPTPEIHCEFKFPTYVFTDKYGIEEIKNVRDKYVKLQGSFSPVLEEQVVSEFNNLTSIYKKERPFRYYLLTPLILAKRFIVNSGSYYLPIHSSNPCYHPIQLLLKIWTSGLYWVTLTFGVIGAFYLLNREPETWVVVSIPIIVIILFPIFLRSIEWRMFEPLFSEFLLLSLIFFDAIYHRRRITHKNPFG